MSDKEKKKPGPGPDRLVIEGDPGEALDRLIGRPPESREKAVDIDTKKCPICGSEMERKYYGTKYSKTTTSEVWVCPNREDGKHPNPYEAEPTGRP